MKAFVSALSIVAVLIGLLLGWGLVEPYFIDVEEYEEVEIPELPDQWVGKEVIHISDWQVGMTLDNVWTIERIVDRTVDRQPAAVVITGDFVYEAGEEPADQLAKVTELLRPLKDISTYAVLGNHDYGDKGRQGFDYELADRVETALEEAGVEVLRNEAVELKAPVDARQAGPEGPALFLAGIDAYLPDRSNPSAALAAVPDTAARIVMMHHPDTFANIPAHAAPLGMAGHTHGGQIRLPFLPRSTWLTYVRAENIHADGWIADYGEEGNRLYVNRGIGFSFIPLRINCPPEMTVFTLQPDT